jgi:peptide/nickel transport system substrate-binding protein
MHSCRPGGTSRGCARATATLALLAIFLSGCSGSLQGQRTDALPTPGSEPAAAPPTATGSPLEPDDPPHRGGKLVVAVPADVNGWNPNINQWTDGGTMMGPSMLETLATVSADGEAEPWLAESWEHNTSFTEWTITVRDGIKFHNGQPLDARAVKRSFDAYFLTGLSSVALKPLYDRVEVSGPRTVTVYLRTEWAQYPSSLASAYMLAPAMLDRPDEGTVAPIGTGPFRYVDWQANKYLRVTRWDGYWRKDRNGVQLPHLDEIEFRPVLADDARQASLVAGEVDLVLTSAPGTAAALEGDHTVIRDYTTERTLLILQTDEGVANRGNPFTNVHARRALAYATDSRDLASLVGEGVQVTTQMYRPDSRWGLPAGETGYHGFDPEGAKRELETYLRETGRRELRFTLKSVPEPRLLSVLQRAQAQWRKLGIEASIDSADQVRYSILVALGEYQAAYYRGYGFSNPDQNHWFLTGDNVKPIGELSLNFTHYRSPTLQRNLQSQRENTEFGVRKAANNAIDREINDQALHIWLFDTPWSIVAQKRVRGLNSFRTHPFANFVTKPWWGEVWLGT